MLIDRARLGAFPAVIPGPFMRTCRALRLKVLIVEFHAARLDAPSKYPGSHIGLLSKRLAWKVKPSEQGAASAAFAATRAPTRGQQHRQTTILYLTSDTETYCQDDTDMASSRMPKRAISESRLSLTGAVHTRHAPPRSPHVTRCRRVKCKAGMADPVEIVVGT